MAHCSKCGTENPDNNKFCSSCGAPLENYLNQASDNNPQNSVEEDGSTPTIVTILLLLFLFPVGIIVMWIWPKWKTWVKILITSLTIVIPILLAVLITTILLSTNPEKLMEKSRDAQRLQDLDTINKAMEFAISNGEITLVRTGICGTCESDSGTLVMDGKTGWVKFEIPEGKIGLEKYLPRLPTDPTNNGEYVYTFISTPTGFEVNAVLESEDNISKMELDQGNDSNVYEIGTDLNIR